MKRHLSFWIAFILLGSFARTTHAQTLGIQGDHFTIDGVPKFPLFVSYFDGMRRAKTSENDLNADFDFFANTKKFNGIRILVNWCASYPTCSAANDTLLDANGNIRDAGNWSDPNTADPWTRFKRVLTRAKAYNLMVDVTFTRETIASGPPTPEDYGDGIGDVIVRLKNEDSSLLAICFFDVQNEWEQHLSSSQLSTVLSHARTVLSNNGISTDPTAAGPKAYLTASRSGASGATAGSEAASNGYQIVAFHDGRDGNGGSPANNPGNWATETTISGDISAIRTTTAIPIAYDEPTAWCEGTVPPCKSQDDSNANHFGDASRLVKKYGGALWTFHTRAGFDLSSNTYVANANANEESALTTVKTAVTGRTWRLNNPLWSESPLAGATIKAVHFRELRSRIDDLRTRCGAGSFSWWTADSGVLTPGVTPVRRQHLVDLQNALIGAYAAAGVTKTYTSITAGVTVIDDNHLLELRTDVIALEDSTTLCN